MSQNKTVKVVVFVPLSHADKVRESMGKAGAGIIGNYDYCTFSVRGIGRYRPTPGAKPFKGKVGKLEAIEEERIETVCPSKKLKEILKAIKEVHPYDEPAIEVYPLEQC